jgi:hypothetical protein
MYCKHEMYKKDKYMYKLLMILVLLYCTVYMSHRRLLPMGVLDNGSWKVEDMGVDVQLCMWEGGSSFLCFHFQSSS